MWGEEYSILRGIKGCPNRIDTKMLQLLGEGSRNTVLGFLKFDLAEKLFVLSYLLAIEGRD